MQSMLLNHFLPRNYEHVLVEKYHGCVQGTCFVQEYSQEFFNLAATNQLTEFLTQQTARYLYGLKANIRDCISLQRMTTPAEVEELAVSIELLEKKRVISSLGTERIGEIRPMQTVRTRPGNGSNRPKHRKIQQKPSLEAPTIFRILLVDRII
ncbi:hypothetical protein TB1_032210 [Malus domestica]